MLIFTGSVHDSHGMLLPLVLDKDYIDDVSSRSSNSYPKVGVFVFLPPELRKAPQDTTIARNLLGPSKLEYWIMMVPFDNATRPSISG